MLLSIIIPTLNEEKYLPNLLDDLKKQEFRYFEIIIADADSTDNTRNIAKKYGAKIVPGGHPGIGRNNGAEEAKGEFFLFLDADVRLKDSNFLQKMFDEFQDKYYEMASCDYVPDVDEPNINLVFEFYNDYAHSVQHFRPNCGGAFMLMTRRLFERLGGFNQELKLAEDHDLARRGFKIAEYGILNSVKVEISTRRIKKEGTIPFIMKILQSEAKQLFKGKITEDDIEYEFGKFDKLESDKDKKEFKLEFNKLKKSFKRLRKRIEDNGLFNFNG
jgi:glycosyltransferase involved in cell wall biosynthesis